MQLTRFDRWLRKKYVYETHIYTMREVEAIPRSIAGYKLPDKQGQRYHYKYVARSEKVAEELTAILKSSSMMFTTRVVDRKSWYVPIIAPEGKSFTWMLVSGVAVLSFISSVVYGVLRVWADPVMRQNILEALDIMRG